MRTIGLPVRVSQGVHYSIHVGTPVVERSPSVLDTLPGVGNPSVSEEKLHVRPGPRTRGDHWPFLRTGQKSSFAAVSRNLAPHEHNGHSLHYSALDDAAPRWLCPRVPISW